MSAIGTPIRSLTAYSGAAYTTQYTLAIAPIRICQESVTELYAFGRGFNNDKSEKLMHIA